MTFSFANLRATNCSYHLTCLAQCDIEDHRLESFLDRLHREDRVRICVFRIAAFEWRTRSAETLQNPTRVRAPGPANRCHLYLSRPLNHPFQMSVQACAIILARR